jgi:hypothetical protein
LAKEFARLSYLIDEIEIANARRLESIGELARARGLSMVDLADEWKTASYRTLQEIWHNDEDAVYDGL